MMHELRLLYNFALEIGIKAISKHFIKFRKNELFFNFTFKTDACHNILNHNN